MVLVAEDEENLAYIAERQLTSLGCHVEQAGNGLVAIEKARIKRYDLILMDVMMPELDGLEATQQIRRDRTAPNSMTPIIAMTAFADRQKCIDAGMNDFLLKPVMLKPIKQVFQKWLPDIILEPSAPDDSEPMLDLSFKKTRNNLAAIDDRIKQLRQRFKL